MGNGPIMIMAGGTGGHVFPGLAVAEALRDERRAVVWLGTHKGLEARLVPAAGIDIEWISISGVRRSGWLAWCAAPFRMLTAVAQALGALRRRRPAAVLGMGGFVSGPGGVAAWLTRRPLVIHEQNAVAGTANRFLAPLAVRVFEAFPASFRRERRAQCIGNPVRHAIAALTTLKARERATAERLHLLILGGSQGARALNSRVAAAIASLPRSLRPAIRHQAGKTIDVASAAYAAAGVEADIVPFIDDMAQAYAWADLVVARAGALTLAELALAGLPAVLIPLPSAVDDHQTRNAEHFATRGAAVLLPERELAAGRLAGELQALLGDPQRLRAMGAAARDLARPDAARDLARACVELAEGRA